MVFIVGKLEISTKRVCNVFAQIRLSFIVVRGLRAPQLLVDSKMAGHGDPALQWSMGCLCKNFTHPHKNVHSVYESGQIYFVGRVLLQTIRLTILQSGIQRGTNQEINATNAFWHSPRRVLILLQVLDR